MQIMGLEEMEIFEEELKAIEIFKEELRKRGLDSEQWHDYVEQAEPICLAYAETLRITADYATNSIEALEDSGEIFESILFCEKLHRDTEKFYSDIAKATKTVMISF